MGCRLYYLAAWIFDLNSCTGTHYTANFCFLSINEALGFMRNNRQRHCWNFSAQPSEVIRKSSLCTSLCPHVSTGHIHARMQMSRLRSACGNWVFHVTNGHCSVDADERSAWLPHTHIYRCGRKSTHGTRTNLELVHLPS